ncbi:TPA: ferredoxin [Streptococcus suis]
MNIKLIPERCIACGLCQTYSELFDYNDDCIVIFSDSEALEKEHPLTDSILKAAKSCPTKAIRLD